jgi:tripartite-type tricarboxylate transporter receptor subunit TctC
LFIDAKKKLFALKRTNVIATLGALVLILFSPVRSHADDYPSHTVKIVVPYEPGGGNDLLARIIGQELGKSLHQAVIIDNRPGAGTQIGAEIVARAAPDGYTLLSTSLTTYALNPSLYKNLPYDPVKDFAPISLTGRFEFLLVANPSFAANSLDQLIALAKSAPDSITFASAGPGSPHQMAMELLLHRAGVQMVHVPYKGAAPALKDLFSGQVPVMMLDVATAREPIKAGLLKPLASASPQRSADFPDVPTIAELGFPGYEASAWQGIVAPAKTPGDIVDKLNVDIGKILADPVISQKLHEAGIAPLQSTPTAKASATLEPQSCPATQNCSIDRAFMSPMASIARMPMLPVGRAFAERNRVRPKPLCIGAIVLKPASLSTGSTPSQADASSGQP